MERREERDMEMRREERDMEMRRESRDGEEEKVSEMQTRHIHTVQLSLFVVCWSQSASW